MIGLTSQSARARRIVLIDSHDPVAIKHAITNSLNALDRHGATGEPAAIEIMACGLGVHISRRS
jgi:hypothetical protein